MKINVTNPEPEFKPVTLSLTLESQAEVDAVYAMLNSSRFHQIIFDAFGVTLPVVDDLYSSGNACQTLATHLGQNA